jgi:hypothetical protein
MTQDLTAQEKETLKELLESKIQDMRAEIAHTDNRDYKNSLKDRKEIVKSILAKLS